MFTPWLSLSRWPFEGGVGRGGGSSSSSLLISLYFVIVFIVGKGETIFCYCILGWWGWDSRSKKVKIFEIYLLLYCIRIWNSLTCSISYIHCDRDGVGRGWGSSSSSSLLISPTLNDHLWVGWVGGGGHPPPPHLTNSGWPFRGGGSSSSTTCQPNWLQFSSMPAQLKLVPA